MASGLLCARSSRGQADGGLIGFREQIRFTFYDGYMYCMSYTTVGELITYINS